MSHGIHAHVPALRRTRRRWISLCALVALVLSVTTSAVSARTLHHDTRSANGASVASASAAKAAAKCPRSTSFHRSCTRRWGVTVPRPTTPTPVPTAPVPSKPTTPAPTAPAPTTPPPTTSVPAGGIVSAATTGVPSGVALQASSGDMNIIKDGTFVENKDVRGNIWIDADDVTIRSSRVTGTGFAVIQVKTGSKGVKVENVEIDGKGAQAGSMGVIGPATVTGSDITGVENGLTPGTGSVLTGNWVHGLKSPGSPHYDGIQIDGGLSDISITRNRIDLREHDQTSAVMIDNYFGPIARITVAGNHLSGGGYTVYSDGQFTGGSITGVSFTDNQLGKGGYGYASIVKNTPVWSGNVDATTGKTVSR